MMKVKSNRSKSQSPEVLFQCHFVSYSGFTTEDTEDTEEAP